MRSLQLASNPDMGTLYRDYNVCANLADLVVFTNSNIARLDWGKMHSIASLSIIQTREFQVEEIYLTWGKMNPAIYQYFHCQDYLLVNCLNWNEFTQVT